MNIDITAETLLGTVGRKGQLALDFGATDSRITSTSFVNKDRFTSGYAYAVCPVNYFAGSLKSELEARFSSYSGATQRTTAPLCGEVGQDVSGTAQGIWFLPNTAAYPEDPHLALVHNNITPTTAVFSIGTSVTDASSGVYTFTPISAGVINRDFKDVTSDGNIYCYETNDGTVFILKLANSNTLYIQKLDQENCNNIPDLDSSAVMFER